jgi:branched-chain amino acid transport system substrate-binding protein
MRSKRFWAGVAALGTVVAVIVALLLWSRQPSATDKSGFLRVVALLPMTGPGGSLGEYCNNGIQIAKEEIARRYSEAVRVEVEILDSKSLPREAVTALQSALARHRPDAIISALSSVSSAIVPIAEREGILTVVTTTAMSGLPKATGNVVRVYPTTDDFVEPVARYMAGHYRRVAVLYVHDDFGESNKNSFVRILQNAGDSITAAEPFELTQTDSRTLVARAISATPDAVFVTGYGPAFIAAFKHLREANRDLPLFSEIGFANPVVLEALGEDADGIVFDGTALELEQTSSDAVESFRAAYLARYGRRPYQVAGFAHDSLLAIAEAAFRVGGSRKPDKASVIALSPFKGAMGTIHFDSDGDSRIELRLMVRRGGRTVLVSE